MLEQFERKVVYFSDNATQTANKNDGKHCRNKENPKN